MNTTDVASKLETTPKVLRRFLRQDPTYNNAGAGGRYDFADKDMPTLKKRFNDWLSKNANRPRGAKVNSKRRLSKGDNRSDIIPVEKIRSRNPRDRAAIRAAAEARVDRLEEMLKASGLHISQMKERDTFRPLPGTEKEEIDA